MRKITFYLIRSISNIFVPLFTTVEVRWKIDTSNRSCLMGAIFFVFQKYVGRLELAQSKEQSVKAVNQGRPLKYKIHFPLRQPIPVVTGLWFNNQHVCSGPRGTYTFSRNKD